MPNESSKSLSQTCNGDHTWGKCDRDSCDFERRTYHSAIAPGDEVLVEAGMYGPWPGAIWCRVTRLAPGSAATYPIKVRLPHGGEGQFKATEILDHRDLTPEDPDA